MRLASSLARNPAWARHAPHPVYIRQHLERITSGALRRLMVFLAPRHGKSEQNTVRYPV